MPDVLKQLGKQWQPFGGAGFLVVLAFLAVSVAVSAVLILGPLLVARARQRAGNSEDRRLTWATLGYFFAVGLAFFWLEVPLLQRFILLLDHPTYSFGVVLFAVLVFSGVGSLLSPKLVRYRGWALLALPLVAGLYALGITPLVQALLELPLEARVATAVLSIAPLALLMGLPFPSGIALLEERQPALIPWAWGINGCASVVGSVLAALMALSWGFSAVMLAAAAVYLVAWLAFAVSFRAVPSEMVRT